MRPADPCEPGMAPRHSDPVSAGLRAAVRRFGPLLLRPADGHPATLSALDLTGVIAALTVVCLAGGQATIRRVTV